MLLLLSLLLLPLPPLSYYFSTKHFAVDTKFLGVVELTTQWLILENILWLPLCRINKFGLNTLPSKTVAIPYTCGLSDLRQTLDSRAGHTSSIYGSRGHASRHGDGYLFRRDNPNYARAECRRRTPSELRRDVARYGGAAHPLCFTDEVPDHEFPEGFKPANIESYDGTTNPVVWIEEFILHIHMARGDDLHAIKYLPLKLKGPARHQIFSTSAAGRTPKRLSLHYKKIHFRDDTCLSQ